MIVQASEVTTQLVINIILDETGSMLATKQQTLDSVNSFLNEQKTDPTPASLNLYLFSNIQPSLRTLISGKSIQDFTEIQPSQYKPMGTTNLYDAVGTVINNQTSNNVLTIIVTDGKDNASHDYTAQTIKQLIEAKSADGWRFVYLGANQDAWNVAQTFGLTKSNTVTYDPQDIQTTMVSLSSATRAYRSGSTKGFFGE